VSFGGSCGFKLLVMRAYVYIDGFNLYYRALKGTGFKWLNPVALGQRMLDPADTVAAVRYFTARVSARSGDPDAPRRQQIYLSALGTLPQVECHFGRFLTKTKMRPLVSTGQFVQVHDTEEKGSDVNLATHLLNDAWHGRFDIALVMSQDTDLLEPIRIVTQERQLKVGLVWLDNGRPNKHLTAVASFVRHASPSDLAASQFTDPVNRQGAQPISKPAGW
jgi:hypothetical protein